MKQARRLVPRLLLSFTVFVSLIALAEGGAFLADHLFHFRDKLLNPLIYYDCHPSAESHGLMAELLTLKLHAR